MASIQFDTREFDNRHIADQNKRLKRLKQAYEKFYKQVAAIGAATGFNDPEKEFYLKDYPQAEKDLNDLLSQLCDQMTKNIEDGNEEAWSIADSKNVAMVSALADKNEWGEEIIGNIKERSADALSAFQGRKVNGMGLSQRIWKSQEGTMQQIEMALELGLSQGKGAAALSRDVRQYLNEPKRLFRRVRDKDGNLRLSKAAEAYHPGRGKYRSSYKNALRLTTTETNMAYRTADHEAHQGMPFVLGFEIHLSGNHPVEDICDELKGVYPKEFKFVGWHPFCRCYTTTVLPSRKELNEWASSSDEEREKYHFSNEVKGMPEQFTKWTEKNAERFAKAKNQPYFIKDNFKGGKIDGGLNWLKPKATKIKLTPEEIGAKRHAARTQADIDDIQSRWNKKRLTDSGYHPDRIDKWVRDYGVDDTRLKKFMSKELKFDAKTHTFPDYEALENKYSRECMKVQNQYDKLQKRFKKIDISDLGARGKKLRPLYDRLRDVSNQSNKYALGTSTAFKDDLKMLEEKVKIATEERANIRKIWEERHMYSLTEVRKELKASGITYNPLQKAQEGRTEEAIIKELSGADITEGSCSSLAFAYAGNKGGMKVLDFRDGESRKFFSSSDNITKIVKDSGGLIEENYDDYKSAHNLFKTMEEGKEYYFANAQHAAIIKKTEKGLRYLELQAEDMNGVNGCYGNGWQALSDLTLGWRFGAQKSHTYKKKRYKCNSWLVSIEDLHKNKGFNEMLGYINTDAAKQIKDTGGGIK